MSAAQSLAGSAPVRVSLWYRDHLSCLQATFASLLLRQGLDPLRVLGLAWGFAYDAAGVTSEEFCYPARDGDLGRALAPYHGLSSRWRRARPSEGLAPLRQALERGALPIAAVDNYHLPFRPAYRDVHAAHLVVVTGCEGETVHVSDAMPPAYQGPVPAAAFLASWHSDNPADVQDAFFSDAPIDGRWLDVDTGGVDDRLPPARLHDALRRNLEGLRSPDDATGLAALHRWLGGVREAAAAGTTGRLAEVYVVGWGMQAQACLHGELLRAWGAERGVAAVAVAGRAVERAGHAWTGLRVAAAHARLGDAAALAQVPRHAQRLASAYEDALAQVERAQAALAALPPGTGAAGGPAARGSA